MFLYGIHNVRGGSYIEVELSVFQLSILNKEIFKPTEKYINWGYDSESDTVIDLEPESRTVINLEPESRTVINLVEDSHTVIDFEPESHTVIDLY
jgi:hypothetical protein